jgi:hypothetical protein
MRIKTGDTVIIHWEEFDELYLEGVVEHEPCEGDELWYIRATSESVKGQLYAINSRASTFNCMRKKEPQNGKD